MPGYADEVGWFEMLLVAVSGVIMGLVCTALLRRHFIEDSELEYPIGEAAAQTLIAGDSGGKTGWKLFGSMGFAGAFTALRDFFGVIPAMLFGNAAVRRCVRHLPVADASGRGLPRGHGRRRRGSSERCWRTSASSWAARPRDSGTWRPRRASCPASVWAS
ncbi:MAG: OPT/YSL family transporter [Eggerthella lenta]